MLNKRRFRGNMISVTILSLFILALIAITPIIHFSTMETVHGYTVTEKERIVGKESSKYLIFTDQEVFENTDSFLSFKFNSSDFYARIQVGQVCSFTVTGYRVPVLSLYRNILDYNCNFLNEQ
jgi:hypothetical protein